MAMALQPVMGRLMSNLTRVTDSPFCISVLADYLFLDSSIRTLNKAYERTGMYYEKQMSWSRNNVERNGLQKHKVHLIQNRPQATV